MKKIKGVLRELSSTNPQTQQKEAVKSDIIEQIEIQSIKDKKFYLDKIEASAKSMQDDNSLKALEIADKMLADMANEPSFIDPMQRLYQTIALIPKENRGKAIDAFIDTINGRFSTKDKTGSEKEEPVT